MANTVEIVVKGTDQTKGAFKQVADDTKRVGDNAKGASNGLKLAAAGAGLLVGSKLVGFLRDSVEQARESNRVNAQTAAVLKSTGGAAHITADEISKLSTKISNKTGIDDEQIQSGENMLLTFTDVRNEVGKGNDIFSQATQTITDMSKAMGQDMKTSAIQVGKALNDPVKGMSALQRVGVTFSESQKQVIKHLVETGDKLGAQKIILGELNKEFGGSAAAQATAGEKLATTWNNAKEMIGNKIIPMLDGLARGLQKTITWMEDHSDGVSQFAVALGAVITAVASYKLIDNMVGSVKALNLAMDANPILAVVAALIALGTWFVITYNKSREFRDNMQDAFSDFKIWCTEAGMAFEQYFVQYVIAGFKFILDGLVKAFGWVPIIGPKLKEAQRAVHGWADDVRDHISNLKADIKTEQLKMKVRDAQRRIDDIKQNRVPGLGANTFAARMEIGRLQYMIDHLQGKTIQITSIYTQINRIFTVQDAASNRGPGGVTSRTGGIWRAAAGGIRSGYGLVGEEGPELVKLPRGSMVYPAGQTRGMLSRMGGSGGGSVVKLEINSGGSKLDDLLVELLRKAIRTRGGDVQLVLGR